MKLLTARSVIAIWTLFCVWSFVLFFYGNPPPPEKFDHMTRDMWMAHVALFRLLEWGIVALPGITLYNFMAMKHRIGVAV